ncbi:MAG TPA: delta-60 repeat domain-containing protein [Dokdonella sp.]|uniref:delta-60 repeat domain-containing protein n=1 Tax=Dokdonella sp. TaxID=2291710 RepID=UPI002B5AF857|nr:delta-60 repeat domain-containing protein [Dokdonella sp.]HUD42314.1 delta-60 repeat domain-containing protein [Dokdonella sp.]
MNIRISALALAIAASPLAAAALPLLDRGFAQDGVSLLPRIDAPANQASLRSVRVAADGSIFLAGTQVREGVPLPYVDKLTPQGVPDTTFGSGGRFALPLDATAYPWGAELGDVTVLPDGRIAFASGVLGPGEQLTSTSLIGVVAANGHLDPGFAGIGYARFDYGPQATQPTGTPYLGTLVADAQQRLLLAAPTGQPAAAVARFRSDGWLDTGYGSQGIAWLPAPTTSRRLQLDGAGRLLVAGATRMTGEAPRLALARLATDGTLDTGFGGGLVTLDGASSASDVLGVGSLELDRAGRPVVGHEFVSTVSLSFSLDVARFTPAGSVDARFNAAAQQPGRPGLARLVNDAALLSGTFAMPTADRRLVVLGTADTFAEPAGLAFVRLRDDASTDPSFPAGRQGPAYLMPVLGTDGNADRIAGVDADGRGGLIVAGQSSGPAGTCHFVLRLIGDRLFADGQDPNSRPTSCPTP